MLAWMTGVTALLTAIAALLGAITLWINTIWDHFRKSKSGNGEGLKATRGSLLKAVAVVILVAFAGAVFAARAWTPNPRVDIISPISSVDVTQKGASVWFSVNGASDDIFRDNSLRLYVLVNSGTEWHVQKAATVNQDGSWALQQAWIGDASAPIVKGSIIPIVAVVSRQQRSQDDKVDTPSDLAPIATSATANVMVNKVNPSP